MSPWLSDLFLRSQSDDCLLALARAGHERAFGAIVQRYRRALQGFVKRLGADGHAEDIVQQTFLQAFAALRAGTEVRHLRRWLHQASRSREHAADFEGLEISAGSAQQIAEMRMLTTEGLSEIARLPSRQHEAPVTVTVQGRNPCEMARLKGLSDEAVRQLVHRAGVTLRAAVTAITPYPLVRALAAARSPSGSLSDVAVGARSDSAAGISVKLVTLVASGAIAAGIIFGSPPQSDQAGNRNARAAIPAAAAPAASVGGMRAIDRRHQFDGGRGHGGVSGARDQRRGTGSEAGGDPTGGGQSSRGPGGGGDGVNPNRRGGSSGSPRAGSEDYGAATSGPSATLSSSSERGSSNGVPGSNDGSGGGSTPTSGTSGSDGATSGDPGPTEGNGGVTSSRGSATSSRGSSSASVNSASGATSGTNGGG